MPIKLKCTCGQSLTVPDALAGKTGKCPKCQASIKIPGSSAGATDAASKPAANSAAKPAAKPAASSAKPASRPAAPATAPVAVAAAKMDDLFDEVGLVQKKGPTCPKCGAGIARGVVLCTSCGFNLQTGEQAIGVKLSSEEEEFDNMFLKEAASNMKREDVSEERHAKAGFPWWMLVSFLFGSLCLGMAGIIVVDATLNEPEPESTFMGKLQRESFGVVAGVTLAAVGCLITFFAHLSIAVFAFKASVGKGFAVLLVPLFNLYYGITTWADNKSGVFGLILGGIIAGVGFFLNAHNGGIRGYYF